MNHSFPHNVKLKQQQNIFFSFRHIFVCCCWYSHGCGVSNGVICEQCRLLCSRRFAAAVPRKGFLYHPTLDSCLIKVAGNPSQGWGLLREKGSWVRMFWWARGRIMLSCGGDRHYISPDSWSSTCLHFRQRWGTGDKIVPTASPWLPCCVFSRIEGTSVGWMTQTGSLHSGCHASLPHTHPPSHSLHTDKHVHTLLFGMHRSTGGVNTTFIPFLWQSRLVLRQI